MTQRYLLHGLVIESEVRLDARPAEAHEHVDLRVTLATALVDKERPAGEVLAGDPAMSFLYSIVRTADGIVAHFPALFEYRLDEELTNAACTLDPGTPAGMAGVLCTGNLVATILGLRGIGVLHASTVAFGDQAIAIAGPAGAGKSTLCALLCAAGATMVGDDVLRVDGTRCFLGSTQLRLRPAAASLAETFGASAVAQTADGRTAITPPQAQQEPSLAAIVLPALSEDFDSVRAEPLSGSKAAAAMLGCARIFGWRLQTALKAQFDLATRLAQTIPVYRIEIPWGDAPFQPGLAETLAEACGVAVAG